MIFIDATVKTSEKECRVVRIMKSSNANVTTEYLIHFKQAGEPVMFSKLSASNSGIYFFNSYRGSRIETSKVVNFTFDKDSLILIAEICQQGAGTFDVIACIKWLSEKSLVETSGNSIYLREVVLHDKSGHIILTICGDMIESAKEDTLYHFTHLSLKNYFGL